MGYGGKVEERRRAQELRGDAWTLQDIADELGVAKSTVSLWVRDVEFEPRPRRRARKRGSNKLERAKAAEIERFRVEGIERIGRLSEREFLMAASASTRVKGDGGAVHFANPDLRLIAFFCGWFRAFFDVDEHRLRVHVYLHEHLDLHAAVDFWSSVTQVPPQQFTKPYRAVVDPSIRDNKHEHGCCHVRYSSTTEHRRLMGLMNAMLLVSCTSPFRGSSVGRAPAC